MGCVRKTEVGSSVAEYGIIGAIVLIGCLVMVSGLGGGLENRFSGLKSDMQSHGTRAAAAKLQTGPSEIRIGMAGSESFTLEGEGANTASDKKVDAQALQTAGSNGEDLYVDGQYLVIKGKRIPLENISSSEMDQLVKHSNKTHEIAELERALEEVSRRSNGDSAAFRNSTVTINGKQYPVNEAAAMLKEGSPYMRDLLELRNSVSKANIDPAITQYVGYVTTSVSERAEALQKMADSGYKSNGNALTIISNDGASDDSHGKGVNVCISGNGQDSGTHCAP